MSLFSLLSGDDLVFSQAQEELKRLTDLITHHDRLYYGEDSPDISDAEYDALRARLQQIEARFPQLIRADSPSQRVGVKSSKGFAKVKHASPMLSLDNAFTEEDVEAFGQRLQKFLNQAMFPECVAELKFDGLSCALTYRDGHLFRGATRGDGHTGEDITANVKTLSDIPLSFKERGIPFPQDMEVRGEIYITKQDFLDLNHRRSQAGEDLFANPRNAAAGSIRHLDPSMTQQRPLKFFAYGLVHPEKGRFQTHVQVLEFLKSLGFPVNTYTKVCSSGGELKAFYTYLETIRSSLPYDIDGVVYKVNALQDQARLGFVARSPRWAIAHKFAPEKGFTTLRHISIQVGRTGVLTPVAELEPLTIGGVVVSRASLHNQDEIDRKDIRVGDTVLVQRAGDVIPQIVESLQDEAHAQRPRYQFPHVCPICHSHAIRPPGMAATLCSGGLICKAQGALRLHHFVSKNAFDIEGLGLKHIETFYKEGLIKTPVDLFTLEERDKESLTPLRQRDGWGNKSAHNLFKAIRAKRTISLERFIYALGIPQVGQALAKTLAQTYKTFAEFRRSVEEAVENKEGAAFQTLISIHGIGDAIVEELCVFFGEPQNLSVLDDLVTILRFKPVEELASLEALPLAGKTVVFTGVLMRLTRQEAKVQAETLGAKVGSSLSSKTDFLVVGESPGSKLKKAQEIGVKILTEDQWLSLPGALSL